MHNIALVYVALYPLLKQCAVDRGYALAIQGSMKRDMDLVAVPWDKDTATPDGLVTAMAEKIGGIANLQHEDKHTNPHGILSYTINFWDNTYIDIIIVQPKQQIHG